MTEIIPYPTPKTSPVLITGMDEDVTMHHFGKYNQDSYFYLAPVTWAGYSTLHDIATRYHNTTTDDGKEGEGIFHTPSHTCLPVADTYPHRSAFYPWINLACNPPRRRRINRHGAYPLAHRCRVHGQCFCH